MPSQYSLLNWVESLQAQGRYTFTRIDAEMGTKRSFVAVQSALRRLKKQSRIVSPRRGFYVIVPPEYRATGSPPASWFIDELMSYIGQPYYVGLLSAAALHGAAHQQPMIYQVMTSKPTREMQAGKVFIRLSMSKNVTQMPVVEKETETGTMLVASIETTAFDLVRYSAIAGHFNNVATVLSELADSIDAKALVEIADLVKIPDVQRLGFLLDAIGESQLADSLYQWLEIRSPRAIPLQPGVDAADVNINNRWHILPNIELEVDI